MHLRPLSRKHLLVVAVIASAAALIPAVALAAPSSPASGATAARPSATSTDTISVDSATLVANGAAVQVVVTVTCGAGDDGNANSTISQAVGVHVAQAASSPGFTCTGKPQQESTLAAADVNGAPFQLGIAVVQATVVDCPGANCTSASANKVLRIRA